MHTSIAKPIAAMVVMMIGIVDAHAENLIRNPDFAQSQSMSGWTWEVVAEGGESEVCGADSICGAMHFSSSECCSIAASGSVASDSSFFDAEALTQCIPEISADTAYDLGAYLRVTTASGLEPGLPEVGIAWYSTTDCSGPELSGAPSARTSQSSAWERVAISGAVAPADVHSAKFLLIAGQTGDLGTSVGMAFDSAFFGPAGSVPVELQAFSVD